MTDPGYDILILGGGFAGATLARRLERRLPADVRVGLVSAENYITFHPLLPEVVGASILPAHVVAPLRQMTGRTDVLMLQATDVNLEGRRVCYRGPGGGVVRYRRLVLACGMTANLHMVPGMAEHAFPLKSVGDALYLRNQVIARLEQAQLEPDPRRRRWLTTYAVIGGGFSGAEVAAEIGDFLDEAVRYYPAVERADCRVILVHGGDRLLPELSPSLGRLAERRMVRQGIEVVLGARAAEVDAAGLTLQSGTRIEAGTTITTVGATTSELIERLDLPTERARVRTAPDMSVPGRPGVWAIGDCAAVPNARDGKVSPPTAQFAARQARQLAENLVRDLRGEPGRAFRYRPAGQLSSIGHNRAVAEVYGVRLSGFVAWLLWRGVYLMKIPTLSRKVRVFLEWNWEMLFPPDIVHLRMMRTVEQVGASRPARGPEPGVAGEAER